MYTNYIIENKLINNTRIANKYAHKINTNEYKYNADVLQSASISFTIASKPSNVIILTSMLILLEKMCNTNTNFIFDTKTLKHKKRIKVGYHLNLYKYKLESFLHTYVMHSLYKIKNKNRVYQFTKGNRININNDKILYNSIFQIKDDFEAFYEIFHAVKYNIQLDFKGKYNNNNITKLLLNLYNFS